MCFNPNILDVILLCVVLMYVQSEEIQNRGSNLTCPFSGHVLSLSCIINIINRTRGLSQDTHFFVSDFFPVSPLPNAGHDLLILKVSRSHTTAHHNR